DHRRAVAGFFGAQRLPQLFACVLVKGNNDAAIATYHADKLVAVEERARGETPQRRRRLVFLHEILRPDELAAVGEAEEVAHGSESVNFAVVNQRRGPWSGGIADLVGGVPIVLPEELARGLI